MREIDQRVRAGGGPEAEVDNPRALEIGARERLANALFLVAGKVDIAARALRDTPLR